MFIHYNDAHDDINAKLAYDGLPSLNYRISAEYGKLERLKSASSKIKDLFGSAMNICAKINLKAESNGLVIGHNLYELLLISNLSIVIHLTNGEITVLGKPYKVYIISSKQRRNIVNPFSRMYETIASRTKPENKSIGISTCKF
jgi:hypothetical protein